LDIELKQIHEKPIAFYLLIAIVVHAALVCGIYYLIVSPVGKEIRPILINETLPPVTKGKIKIDPVKISSSKSINNTSNQTIPPFEPSGITSDRISEKTFIHEKSGLLFADEIIVSRKGVGSKLARKAIIEPKINRDFSLNNLPRQFRNREWNLTLRLRVNQNGDPVGYIRIAKSSGDKVLDQLTANRVKESRFEPAHYEGSTEYFDYTFDMEIHYQ
jgi:outer membrane biosynthesis protein TonB